MEDDIDKLKALLLKSLLSLPDLDEEARKYPSRVIANYQDDEAHICISTASVKDGFKPFETAIIHPRYNRGKWMIVEAYATEAEAEAGHYRWVAKMTCELPEVIADCINCVPAQCCLEAEGKLEYQLDAIP